MPSWARRRLPCAQVTQTPNPGPSTLYPKPSLNPGPSTRNPGPSTLYPKPSLNPGPSTRNPGPSTLCTVKFSHFIRQRATHDKSPETPTPAHRGIRTLSVRMKRHEETGLVIASWLEERTEVKRVMHPALQTHPQHNLWKRDFTGDPPPLNPKP